MKRMSRYGKKKTEFWSSTKTGRFPFIRRMFVQRSVTSVVDGISNRSASSGCSPLMWSTTFWITAPILADRRPDVSRTLVRVRGGRSR